MDSVQGCKVKLSMLFWNPFVECWVYVPYFFSVHYSYIFIQELKKKNHKPVTNCDGLILHL